jgi:hypothetical protein
VAHREWTDEDIQRLREMVASGETDARIARALGRNANQVTLARRRHDIPGGQSVRTGVVSPDEVRGVTLTRVVSETPERVVIAPEESDEEPIGDLWDRATKATGRKIAKTKAEGRALIRLMTDKPVLLSISSDWHISPTGSCDLAGLRAYAEAIQQAPGAYAIAVGDLVDNPIKWSKQMLDVPDEARLLDYIMGVFGSKLLATTDGNHDAWSRQFAGLDNIRRLAALHRVHYSPDELVYTVELVSPKTHEVTARYVIATRHQYRRNSALNWTHAAWRWVEDNLQDWPRTEDGGVLLPDIVAIGHNHCAEVAERTYEGGKRWAARMGPFQVHSSHARQFGWSRGAAVCPSFILHPHRAKPIDGFSEYERALEVLARERAEYDADPPASLRAVA